jgi:hypothetical protein
MGTDLRDEAPQCSLAVALPVIGGGFPRLLVSACFVLFADFTLGEMAGSTASGAGAHAFANTVDAATHE